MACLVFWGALFLLMHSCEKDLELEIREQGGQLVLFSFISPDSLLRVHLSKSVSHLSVNDFERVYDGSVMIWQNGTLVDSFIYPYQDLWATRPAIKVSEGDTFRIEAHEPPGNSVVGTTRIPVAVPIAGLETVVEPSLAPDGSRQEMLVCTLTIDDPPEEDNYYQLHLFERTCRQNDQDWECTDQIINFSKDDPLFYYRDQEGSLLGGIDFEGTFSDFLFSGQKYRLTTRLPVAYAEAPDEGTRRTLYFLLVSQTADYFNYLRSRVVAEYSYDLPIVDPIRIFYNVENGLGLVGGLSASADSLVFLPESDK